MHVMFAVYVHAALNHRGGYETVTAGSTSREHSCVSVSFVAVVVVLCDLLLDENPSMRLNGRNKSI